MRYQLVNLTIYEVKAYINQNREYGAKPEPQQETGEVMREISCLNLTLKLKSG